MCRTLIRRVARHVWAFGTLALLSACATYGYQSLLAGRAPADFLRPATLAFQPDTPLTTAQADLGGRLFHDPLLSGDGTRSCASCHDPAKGYEDGRPTAQGVNGAPLARHTPTLWNVGLRRQLFWDGRSPSLEDQALRPVANPDEMNLDPALLVARLSADPDYRAAFAAAFPGSGAITTETISRAIATFERTLISPPTAFDAFAAGDETAITPAAQRGFDLFVGRAGCASCHGGWAFTDARFHDIGLPGDDAGRGAITGRADDQHTFPTPTLRELSSRAPYMHDGLLPTLAAVVDHYADHRSARPNARRAVTLTQAERADIVAFLLSLDSTVR